MDLARTISSSDLLSASNAELASIHKEAMDDPVDKQDGCLSLHRGLLLQEDSARRFPGDYRRELEIESIHPQRLGSASDFGTLLRKGYKLELDDNSRLCIKW